MGRNSEITWTHHTFNPWWGCTKISEACTNCYAEAWSKRSGVKWGPAAERRFFKEDHWNEPVKWNKEAKNSGERRRVFCASMADVLEFRHDLDSWRERLWKLIEDTPRLDWLVLTKRPENFAKMIPWSSNWPPNIWIGTTAENQERANERVPVLIEHPALIKFVSCEPLLGPIDLSQWLNHRNHKRSQAGIDWVIVGGESGINARPMNPMWGRILRDQCSATQVPFHFKQWGCWRPSNNGAKPGVRITRLNDPDSKSVIFIWKGKKASGRDLDGRIWDEIPLAPAQETLCT
jgi:protein gp37